MSDITISAVMAKVKTLLFTPPKADGNDGELTLDNQWRLRVVDSLGGATLAAILAALNSIIKAVSAAYNVGDKGATSMAVRHDAHTSLAALTDEYIPFTTNPTGDLYTDLSAIRGTAVDTAAGAKSAGTQRVTLASDDVVTNFHSVANPWDWYSTNCGDFTATPTVAGTTITLSVTSLGGKAIDAGMLANAKCFVYQALTGKVVRVYFDNVNWVVATGVLDTASCTGHVTFAANDVVQLSIPGSMKSYDPGSDTTKTTEQASLDGLVLENPLINGTFAGATSPGIACPSTSGFAMFGYGLFSFSGSFICAAGGTFTLSVWGSNVDTPGSIPTGGVPGASGSGWNLLPFYNPATDSFCQYISFTASATEQPFAGTLCKEDCNYKLLTFFILTPSDTNTTKLSYRCRAI